MYLKIILKEKSGFYYTIYSDGLGNNTMFYEVPPIEVIKKDETKDDNGSNSKTILIVVLSVFGFIIIFVGRFLLYHCLRKKIV